ncbi:MAG: hypothetical protein QXN16_02990 [Candidatus Micrarchaeaceae archaeon]
MNDNTIKRLRLKPTLAIASAARADERKRIIAYLSARNPYPADIFVGNTKKIKAILYEDGTQSPPDGRFGSFGRQVWNNVIKEIEEMEE